MGRFEDLVDQAAEGNAEAAESLRTEFGGTALREQADKGRADAKKYEEALPDIRKAKFMSGIDGLDKELVEVLNPNDVKGMAPDEITQDLLKSKAQERIKTQGEALESQASELGFETVEEMQEAFTKTREANETKRKAAEAIGGTVSSSSGDPTPDEPQETFDKAKGDYDAAIKGGQTKDRALGEFTHTLMADQAEVAIEEGDER